MEGTYHTRVSVDTDNLTEEYSEGNNQGGATYTVFPLKIRVKNLANGDSELTWKSAAGFTYTVERASSPSGPYAPIATGVTATPPKNTFLDDAVPPGVMFYRVWGSR